MIKYFVRTTGQRQFNYDIEYTTLLDTEHNGPKHFVKSLLEISNYDSVLMEDDLVLCNNFKYEIEKVITQYPNNIITFFDRPTCYYTTHFTTIIGFNQCMYFPKTICKIIASKMHEIYASYWTSYTGRLRSVLAELNIPVLNYRPCLVQHIDGKSILNNGRHYERNTIYFKDYLDKLGITMEEAFDKNNYDALTKLLEQDRQEWYN